MGRTLAGGSAFRPVVTGRGAGDWSPSRRAQHEPRLPYFHVRPVGGDSDGGRRFFQPIDKHQQLVVPVSTDDAALDSGPVAATESGAGVILFSHIRVETGNAVLQTHWRYVALVVVLWRPALSSSAS